MLQMMLPKSKAEYKIIKEVYENPGINISTLLKKTKTSPNAGYKYINSLLKANIIEEVREGNKPTFRLFYPKFSEVGKNILILIEEEEKQDFLDSHKELKGALIQFENGIKDEVDCALIFGSFARGNEGKNSDIDILVLGKEDMKKKIESSAEHSFVSVGNNISLRFNKTSEFIKQLRENDSFALGIKKEHIIIANIKKWIDIISKLSHTT